MTDEEKDQAYNDYLRSHAAHDHALCRVLNWVNAHEAKTITRKELYHMVMDMRGDDL